MPFWEKKSHVLKIHFKGMQTSDVLHPEDEHLHLHPTANQIPNDAELPKDDHGTHHRWSFGRIQPQGCRLESTKNDGESREEMEVFSFGRLLQKSEDSWWRIMLLLIQLIWISKMRVTNGLHPLKLICPLKRGAFSKGKDSLPTTIVQGTCYSSFRVSRHRDIQISEFCHEFNLWTWIQFLSSPNCIGHPITHGTNHTCQRLTKKTQTQWPSGGFKVLSV